MFDRVLASTRWFLLISAVVYETVWWSCLAKFALVMDGPASRSPLNGEATIAIRKAKANRIERPPFFEMRVGSCHDVSQVPDH